MDRGAWGATEPWGHKRAGHDLVTKQQLYIHILCDHFYSYQPFK